MSADKSRCTSNQTSPKSIQYRNQIFIHDGTEGLSVELGGQCDK